MERPPRLGCSYETNGSPYLLLQPAKKETLRLQPYIALYHDFISDAEAETIKGLAGPWVSSRGDGDEVSPSRRRIPKRWWLVAHPEQAEMDLSLF